MRPFATLALLLTPAVILSETAPVPDSLARMVDRYRPVLVFAPDGDPRLRQQVETLSSHRSDLIDRQIMLVPFVHKEAGQVDPAIVTLLSAEEPSLRKRFHIKESDFTVILIGKDGGEKLRSNQPISFEKLRDTVDAMPMRRDEMHKSDHFR